MTGPCVLAWAGPTGLWGTDLSILAWTGRVGRQNCCKTERSGMENRTRVGEAPGGRGVSENWGCGMGAVGGQGGPLMDGAGMVGALQGGCSPGL